jgi:hypothetical protein
LSSHRFILPGAAALAAGVLALPSAAPAAPRPAPPCKRSESNIVKPHGSFTTKFTAPGGHRPKADKNYPIKLTGRKNGKPISGGHIYYQFLYQGQVVACRNVGKPKVPYFKKGVFTDILEWPKRAVGFDLTLRLVVKTKYGVKNVDYKVKVRK